MLYCADVFSRAPVEQSDERRAQRRYMTQEIMTGLGDELIATLANVAPDHETALGELVGSAGIVVVLAGRGGWVWAGAALFCSAPAARRRPADCLRR
jgi:hypothetical protein